MTTMRLVLASTSAMPGIPGLAVPAQAYWVLEEPAPLLGAAQPTVAMPWTALYAVGVRRVVCLTEAVPAYDPSPLSFACAIALQDLYGGRDPGDSDGEARKVRTAAASAVEALRRGEGVIVHCTGGTGRTGSVLGVALVALGLSSTAAIAHLRAVNAARGKAWPESAWQEQLVLQLPA